MITLILLFIAWVTHIITGNFIFGGLDSLSKMVICAMVGIFELTLESIFVMSLLEKLRGFYAERRRKELEKCRRY